MRTVPIHLWGTKRFKWLVDHPGIGEVRFMAKKVQQRPLGYCGPETKNFTFLIAATERGNRFVPPDAPGQAEQRRKVVQDEPRRAKKYELN